MRSYSLEITPSVNQLIFDISMDDPLPYVYKITRKILKKKRDIHPIEVSEYLDTTKPFFIKQSSHIISERVVNLAIVITMEMAHGTYELSEYRSKDDLVSVLNRVLLNLKNRVISEIVYIKYRINNEKYMNLPRARQIEVLDSIAELIQLFRNLSRDQNNQEYIHSIVNFQRRS